MRMKRILSLLTLAAAAFAVPAAAQMYPGEDVIVNPAAIPPQGLLNPGQPYPGIVLTPPNHRVRRHRKVDTTAAGNATPEAASQSQAEAQPGASASVPSRERHAKSNAPTGTTDTASSLPFTFGEDEAPQAAPTAKVATREMPAANTKKASAGESGLAKRGAILFEHDATSPQPSQLDGIKLLASDLNAALEAGATQIELEAFGGPPGDKSSDARRTSLRRALAVRQLLIDDGVPSNRIVTRAMGGITDKGEPDRVDIYIRSS